MEARVAPMGGQGDGGDLASAICWRLLSGDDVVAPSGSLSWRGAQGPHGFARG